MRDHHTHIAAPGGRAVRPDDFGAGGLQAGNRRCSSNLDVCPGGRSEVCQAKKINSGNNGQNWRS